MIVASSTMTICPTLENSGTNSAASPPSALAWRDSVVYQPIRIRNERSSASVSSSTPPTNSTLSSRAIQRSWIGSRCAATNAPSRNRAYVTGSLTAATSRSSAERLPLRSAIRRAKSSDSRRAAR
jgi:hypothetical protein